MESAEELIPLSEAQAKVLQVLRDAERPPKWIAPITRTWLVSRGLVSAQPLGRGRRVFAITELGLKVLKLHEAFVKLFGKDGKKSRVPDAPT